MRWGGYNCSRCLKNTCGLQTHTTRLPGRIIQTLWQPATKATLAKAKSKKKYRFLQPDKRSDCDSQKQNQTDTRWDLSGMKWGLGIFALPCWATPISANGRLIFRGLQRWVVAVCGARAHARSARLLY